MASPHVVRVRLSSDDGCGQGRCSDRLHCGDDAIDYIIIFYSTYVLRYIWIHGYIDTTLHLTLRITQSLRHCSISQTNNHSDKVITELDCSAPARGLGRRTMTHMPR